MESEMAESVDHNRIIATAAKASLAPLGCKRKGKSRLWFDDHLWWVTVIEFQPSSWGKGSYLNVGAMWLWNAKGYWSFDDEYRIEDFRQFIEEGQFSGAAEQLAQRAADQVLVYREKFSSLSAVAKYLDGKENKTIKDHYHAAIALALSGANERASQELSDVLLSPADAPWVEELQTKMKELFAHDSSSISFRTAVWFEISRARGLLKMLPLSQGVALWP
jgi:hypothetical protein